MITHCGRCRGLLVRDHFFDLLDDSGHLSFKGLRCVSCGNILDPLILKNRREGRNRPPGV